MAAHEGVRQPVLVRLGALRPRGGGFGGGGLPGSLFLCGFLRGDERGKSGGGVVAGVAQVSGRGGGAVERFAAFKGALGGTDDAFAEPVDLQAVRGCLGLHDAPDFFGGFEVAAQHGFCLLAQADNFQAYGFEHIADVCAHNNERFQYGADGRHGEFCAAK